MIFGSQAYHEINSMRDKLFYSYKLAEIQQQSKTLKTGKGLIVEDAFRKWLNSFLPSKYGVTKGFIVSPLIKSDHIQLVNFDVIIYDKLNSPILWSEGDHTDVNVNKGIPVEYALCVLEIKCRLTSKSAKDAVNQLLKLEYYLGTEDDSNNYRKYLPKNFCCGLVFFEFKNSDKLNKSILNNLNEIYRMNSYFGGTIISNDINKESAEISPINHDCYDDGSKLSSEQNIITNTPVYSSSNNINDEQISTMIYWSHISFTNFAFKLLSLLNGTYRSGFISSFYGLHNSGKK